MKKLYFSLVFLLLNSAVIQAENFRGFLLTKDNYRLTGYINKIEYSLTGIVIQFTNDFGDRYRILPNLVKGFGFTAEDGEQHRYVSYYHQGRWLFLRSSSTAGKRLQLLTAPKGPKEFVDDSFQAYFAEPIPEYWLQLRGEEVLPVERTSFRRDLRAYLAATAPDLSMKIGKKGYRYRDLEFIVEEYNKRARRSSRRL